MSGKNPGEAERLRQAARLGAACGAYDGTPASQAAFLRAVVALSGASGGFLGVALSGGSRRIATEGLNAREFEQLCDGGPEPRTLTEAAGERPLHLFGAALARVTLGSAALGGPLLRIGVEEAGGRASLGLCFAAADADRARAQAGQFELLLEPLVDALRQFDSTGEPESDGPLELAALGAWSRCNVPLLFLTREGAVVAANPAALRKLGLDGTEPELPDWLRGEVDNRIDGLRRGGGIPDGVSGDYAWVAAHAGSSLFRVGLAPVSGGAASEAAWLLSVENGGPTLEERVQTAETAFGLTPREADVLGALAQGYSNKLIASAVGISEATVKFHLVSVMRKAGTSNRTELLSSLYSLPG